MKVKQLGIMLIGFLMILIIVVFFGFMVMKLVLLYVEFMGVKKVMSQIVIDGVNGCLFDMICCDLIFKMGFQYVDDVIIQLLDIIIECNNGVFMLVVSYDKQVLFIVNIDFLLYFDNSVVFFGIVGE